MKDDSPELPLDTVARPRFRVLKGIALVAVVLVAVAIVADLSQSYGSAAFERSSEGAAFELVEGSADRRLSLSAFYTDSEANFTGTLHRSGEFGLPTNLSSLTIVDVTASKLSRRVAHALMERVKKIPSIRFVEVRLAGEQGAPRRIGEVVVFLEEFNDTGGGLFGRRSVDYKLTSGANPAFGWVEPACHFPRWAMDWSISVSVRSLCLPTHLDNATASAIAGAVTIDKLFADLKDEGPTVEAFAAQLLPASFDAPSLEEVEMAAGLSAPPLIHGMRVGKKAEVWWRVLAPDVTPQLAAAVNALTDQGWVELKGGSRGVDGKVHRAILRRGTEIVDLQFEENRSTRYVNESWTRSQLADGTWGDEVHRMEGETIDSALWVHYWNGCTVPELRAQEAELSAESPGAATAFVAALPYARQIELGAPIDSLPEGALTTGAEEQ